jgi:myo-inositol-1(or 4)-monophosphatase
MEKIKDIELRRDIAIQSAKQAGKLLLDNFGKVKQIKEKGHRQLVTELDLEAEKIIKDLIIKNFPQENIISEENPLKKDSDFSWIIDPLDGTHNYIHNIDIFGVSVALAYKKEVVLGVIYMPVEDELYFAIKGEGAFKNGKRISVSDRDIQRATLIFDSSIRYQKERMLRDLKVLSDAVFNIRMFGSTVRSLSYIAEGKVEAEIEYNDKIWDFASGLLLVEEAGGKVSDLKGNFWDINCQGYIASNKKIYKKLLRLINP